MAVSDNQLDALIEYAGQLASDGVLADPIDDEIMGAVLDYANFHGMFTEDEYEAPLTWEDFHDRDVQDIIAAYNRNDRPDSRDHPL